MGFQYNEQWLGLALDLSLWSETKFNMKNNNYYNDVKPIKRKTQRQKSGERQTDRDRGGI